jgi:hypothetical protein
VPGGWTRCCRRARGARGQHKSAHSQRPRAWLSPSGHARNNARTTASSGCQGAPPPMQGVKAWPGSACPPPALSPMTPGGCRVRAYGLPSGSACPSLPRAGGQLRIARSRPWLRTVGAEQPGRVRGRWGSAGGERRQRREGKGGRGQLRMEASRQPHADSATRRLGTQALTLCTDTMHWDPH